MTNSTQDDRNTVHIDSKTHISLTNATDEQRKIIFDKANKKDTTLKINPNKLFNKD